MEKKIKTILQRFAWGKIIDGKDRNYNFPKYSEKKTRKTRREKSERRKFLSLTSNDGDNSDEKVALIAIRKKRSEGKRQLTSESWKKFEESFRKLQVENLIQLLKHDCEKDKPGSLKTVELYNLILHFKNRYSWILLPFLDFLLHVRPDLWLQDYMMLHLVSPSGTKGDKKYGRDKDEKNKKDTVLSTFKNNLEKRRKKYSNLPYNLFVRAMRQQNGKMGRWMETSLIVALCFRSSNRKFIINCPPLFKRLLWLHQNDDQHWRTLEEEKGEETKGKIIHMSPNLENYDRKIRGLTILLRKRIYSSPFYHKFQRQRHLQIVHSSSHSVYTAEVNENDEVLKLIMINVGINCVDVILIILNYCGTWDSDKFSFFSHF